MKSIIPLILVLFCSGCYTAQPVTTDIPENNATYKVDYLFEHDGCKVYRFYDRGNYIYFTNCQGESIARTDSTEIRNTTGRQVNPWGAAGQ